jgi:hypothetical protein
MTQCKRTGLATAAAGRIAVRLVWLVYLSKSPVQFAGSCRIYRCTIGAAQHLHQTPFDQAIDNAVSQSAGKVQEPHQDWLPGAGN